MAEQAEMVERFAKALTTVPAIPRGRPGALPRNHNIRDYWREFDRWLEEHGDALFEARDLLKGGE